MKAFNAVDMDALSEEDVRISRTDAVDIVAAHGAVQDWFGSDQSDVPEPGLDGTYSAYELFSWLGY